MKAGFGAGICAVVSVSLHPSVELLTRPLASRHVQTPGFNRLEAPVPSTDCHTRVLGPHSSAEEMRRFESRNIGKIIFLRCDFTGAPQPLVPADGVQIHHMTG